MLQRFMICGLALLVLVFAVPAMAQDSGSDMEELSKKAANPLSLPLIPSGQ